MDFADVSLIENYYVGVYNIPKVQYTSFDLYFRPLDATVWICIMLTFIFSTMVLSIKKAMRDPHFIRKFSHRSKRDSLSFLCTHMMDTLFLVWTTLLGRSYTRAAVNKIGDRNMLFGMLCMFGIVVVTVWSAKIISYLTVSVKSPPFRRSMIFLIRMYSNSAN